MMRPTVLPLIIVLLIAVPVTSHSAKENQTIAMNGDMVCLWCDVVAKNIPDKADEEHKCMAAFKSDTGRIYTLVPDEMGKQLGALAMHEQKVAVEAFIIPKSQIIQVINFKVTEKVKPKTPETEPWFNF